MTDSRRRRHDQTPPTNPERMDTSDALYWLSDEGIDEMIETMIADAEDEADLAAMDDADGAPCTHAMSLVDLNEATLDDDGRAALDAANHALTAASVADAVCETCHGTRKVTTAGDLIRTFDGGWTFQRITIACPDCTAEGAAWLEEDMRRFEAATNVRPEDEAF